MLIIGLCLQTISSFCALWPQSRTKTQLNQTISISNRGREYLNDNTHKCDIKYIFMMIWRNLITNYTKCNNKAISFKYLCTVQILLFLQKVEFQDKFRFNIACLTRIKTYCNISICYQYLIHFCIWKVYLVWFGSGCDKYSDIQIFSYTNIRSYHIRIIFVSFFYSNIFGYSFVLFFFYMNIFGYSFVSFF